MIWSPLLIFFHQIMLNSRNGEYRENHHKMARATLNCFRQSQPSQGRNTHSWQHLPDQSLLWRRGRGGSWGSLVNLGAQATSGGAGTSYLTCLFVNRSSDYLTYWHFSLILPWVTISKLQSGRYLSSIHLSLPHTHKSEWGLVAAIHPAWFLNVHFPVPTQQRTSHLSPILRFSHLWSVIQLSPASPLSKDS